nr:hypothetical protein GCM10020093_063260 [Planobispora longispora]
MLLFLYRHRVFAAVLAAAFLLRMVTMLGYGPALWFNDSYEYVSGAVYPDRPSALRPNGYSFWLLLLRPFHSFALVAFTQHLMGLAVGGLVYALLRARFGLPGWGAALAAAPALFDAYQIQLEHMIMSDTMFTLLVVGVITLVLWHRTLSWKLGAAIGLLLAITALTRSIGLPILALVVVYLLVKRTGWKPVAAMVTVCAVPVAGYMAWFASAHGNVAMTNSDGAILYMRTAMFADCKKMGINPREELELALLCISDPPEQRQFGQKYLWWARNGQRFHAFGTGTTFTPEMSRTAGISPSGPSCPSRATISPSWPPTSSAPSTGAGRASPTRPPTSSTSSPSPTRCSRRGPLPRAAPPTATPTSTTPACRAC